MNHTACESKGFLLAGLHFSKQENKVALHIEEDISARSALAMSSSLY